MPIDPSIFQNVQNPQPVNIPGPLDMAQKAMTLSQLGMQQMQMARQLRTQSAMQEALTKNTDASGNLNADGAVQYLGQIGMPQAGMQLKEQIAQSQKAQDEQQTAHMQAWHQISTATSANYGYLLGLYRQDPSSAEKAYPSIRQSMIEQGIPNAQKMPESFDLGLVRQGYDIASRTKEQLENKLTQATTAKTQAETAKAQSETIAGKGAAELNANLYGSRSPNAELTSQYNTDVKPIRSSQIYMQQMLDSYKNKTPQGDAALVLNNFLIRSPHAADVNSIDEMKTSQSVPDAWKNKLNMALAGGFNQATRDNLIRDGISAYRANTASLQGIQKRYQARQSAQGVSDPTLTYEPAIKDTSDEATKLQDKLGPYVPPAQRPGSWLGRAENMMGLGSAQSANASDQAAPKYAPPGSKVSGNIASQYAIKHGMTLKAAQDYLRSRGYAVDR